MILIDQNKSVISFNQKKIIFPWKFEKIFIIDEILLVFLTPFFDWNDNFFSGKVKGSSLEEEVIEKFIELDVVLISKEKFEEYKNSNLDVKAFDKKGKLWETGGYQEYKEYDRFLFYYNDKFIWELKDVQKWDDLLSHNIIVFNQAGEQLWQIKSAKEILGGGLDGTYTGISLKNGNLWAYNWVGFGFTIDIKTGEVLEKVFTK